MSAPRVVTGVEGEPEYSIMNGWLVEFANACTCYGGGPYGHESGCGYEPIAKVEDLLAKAAPTPAPTNTVSVEDVASVLLMNSPTHSTRCYRQHWCYDCVAKASVQATAVLALFDQAPAVTGEQARADSLNLTVNELRLSRAVDLVAPGGLQCSYEDANWSCEEESIASALVADRWFAICAEHLAIYNNGPTPLWKIAKRAANLTVADEGMGRG
jgi:hypothetical protein